MIEELRTGADAFGNPSDLDSGGFSSADADAAMRLILQVSQVVRVHRNALLSTASLFVTYYRLRLLLLSSKSPP